MTKTLMITMLLGLTAAACGETDKFFDCNDICREVDQCIDIDRQDCRQDCRQDASQDDVDACESCLDTVPNDECFSCANECSDVVSISSILG
ncbi:MAG: hypothetical protein R3C68_18480 [Myxococcota bacterium]